MLIRSQDKSLIINFDNVDTIAVSEYKTNELYRISTYNGDCGTSRAIIGRYSTKEKALKVLDMIQEEYSKYIEVKGGSDLFNNETYQYNILTIPKVFEMPANDSEVLNE